MESGQPWRQYVFAGIANVAILSTGYAMVWPSAVFTKLVEGRDSPLPGPVSFIELSLIASLLTVGAIFGPFIAGFLSSRVGRKWSVISGGVALLAGWVMLVIARGVAPLYAGRVLCGVGTGMLFTATPMYCSEIATDACRGALGSFLQIFITVGFLLLYAIGSCASYNLICYIGIGMLAVFFGISVFMPDSPIYYLIKNDREAAAKSLMVLRGKSRENVESELQKLVSDVDASKANKTTATCCAMFRGGHWKALYISLALMIFQQCSGVNAILFYLSWIFNISGYDLSPEYAAIIVGFVQVVASLMTSVLVDRLGRRVLLLISTAGTATALMLFGSYMFLEESGSPLARTLTLVPLASMMLFIVTYSWGLGPLPFVIMSELCSVEIKSAAMALVTSCSWILTFFITLSFMPMLTTVGTPIVFWIFCTFCVLGFFFTLFFVPETKGKSYQEIQDILAGRKKSEIQSNQDQHINEAIAIAQQEEHENAKFWKLDGTVNQRHDWFYQVQGQLHITNREYCLFAVWTGKYIKMKIIKILKDDTFWKDQMEQKLINFYNQCLLPEIVDPRKSRSMPIRDNPY